MTRPTLEYQTPPRQLIRDDWAYMLPMFVFLGFTWMGGHWKNLYPLSYVIKTFVVAGLLALLWKHYTKIRWNFWWLGVLVGVIGIFQWVGMQLFLQHHFAFFKPSPDVFDATKFFEGKPVALMWSFIAIRIAGATLVVPVMEELFWRDWLWRTVIAPNDFKLAQVGERDWRAFAVVCGAFAFVHGNWWLTSIVWAAMIGLLLIYTRSLGACILAHGVTNLLLALYVLHTRDWSFW
jgi:CAAX prenyl protease-like protein